MYHVGDGARTVILNHTPGYGQLELASLRKDIPCISIVANCKHRVILEQRLILDHHAGRVAGPDKAFAWTASAFNAAQHWWWA